MPNISKKTAYDVKEASDQSLSKGARKHYAENAQAGFKSDQGHGSFMSKHSQSRMSSSPLNQGVKEEDAVMKSRKKNMDHHQGVYNAFDKKAQGFKATSQKQVDAINSRYSNLAANVNTRVARANKSADSINKVRKSKNSKSAQDFNKLMDKS